MRIYFNNHQYLNISNYVEESYAQTDFLLFDCLTTISMQQLKNLFIPENLKKITITNENNIILNKFENKFLYLVKVVRSQGEDGNVYINVQLGSNTSFIALPTQL